MNVKMGQRLMLFLFVAWSFMVASCGKKSCNWGKTYSLAEMIQPIPVGNVQKDSAWNIWGASMVKGYDNKYHLYFSRWPRQSGHESWISHSEIAYAVADKPEGPFRFVKTALPARGSEFWDGAMTHNPYMVLKDGKYYLYYIGTTGEILKADQKLTPYGDGWWSRRNKQRIGVAVADKPEGPWVRSDKPVLTVSDDTMAFDAMCVNNPAICVGRNGKIVMLYKAVCKNGTQGGGAVRFSVAFADSPTGPFVKTNQLIFQPEDSTARMVAEDPYLWYDKEKDQYFAIVRDVVAQFTGEDSGGLALMVSDDAINWRVATCPKVLPAQLEWEDGTIYDAKKNHIERPFLYRNEKGIPSLLFGTFSVHTNGIFREHSFNGRIPLSMPEFNN